jgi:hypothetical protein
MRRFILILTAAATFGLAGFAVSYGVYGPAVFLFGVGLIGLAVLPGID